MNELIKVLGHYNLEYDEKIVCPFHNDINPSLKLDNNENFWYCFGCQEGGDAYKFHKKMQNLKGEKNEIKILQIYNNIIKGKIGKEVYERSQNIKIEIKNRAYYRQCLIEAKDYYYGLKKVNWFEEDNEALDYMLYRGYKRSILNDFGAKNTYRDAYQIIFPIRDNGKFKGWVCRTFDPEIAKQRKYLYNKGFRRKTTLAGNYKKANIVMLVEGYFDMLKARQLGVKKVAAILGWKITDKQIMKLKAQGVDIIISALDNDECGERGTKYLKNFFKVKRFPYPKNIKDMGDMAKEEYKDVILKDKFLKEALLDGYN